MKYEMHSFRHGEIILANEAKYVNIWLELLNAIESITEEEIIKEFESAPRKAKSLSEAINKLLKEKFTSFGWTKESSIFQGENYNDNRWRLDFAKESISIEVAFNHGEAIAWNLIKPVLASELNHVKKQIESEIGVIICATKDLKEKGGFDGAVGEYEKFLTYLNPLRDLLSVPMVIIGLKAPETFKIEIIKENEKKIGKVTKV
ncbi:MAG: hypothetical protein KU37_08955 [Sulfuricurvum sp. PC08-66]|nr:MAG: hypothetical protein KU37_08955 [Sulfuricurvum sp. PC08-66]